MSDSIRLARPTVQRPPIEERGASCEHLLVRTAETPGTASRVVGTYRVLMPAAAYKLGGYYTETEFDLSPLKRLRLPLEALRQDLDVEPPALVKGYLKCGARLLGEPAWDPGFNTADLPMMLRLADLPEAYRRRIL
jgi:putative hemolysin